MRNEEITSLKIGNLPVIQPKEGYRFSLDPILLCDFATIPSKAKVADLGTGSGIIPLLLNFQSKGCFFYGIERQPDMVCRARRSVAMNGLQERIKIVEGDVRQIPREIATSFDAVVCNPPYRKKNAGRIAPNEEKAAARHELAGGLEDFLRAARILLKPGGSISMVYSVERMVELLAEMQRMQLEPKQLRLVHPREGRPANLVLVSGNKNSRPGLRIEPPLVIYKGEGRSYSQEVLQMSGIARAQDH